MATGIVRANGIDICFETFGDPGHPALLLVMGLGVQMTEWEPSFCQQFADRGFHVIRFDNRDTGLSTHFAGAPTDRPPYTLADMASDAAGLLDALGVPAAHLVGASMGGMIAQTIAIRYPERVLSLCSIMSTTGRPDVAKPTREAFAVIVAPVPDTREGVVEAAVARAKVLRGGGFPFDEEAVRRRSGAAYDRSFDSTAKARQRAAIAATVEDRTEALGRLRVPVVVIHGAADPLVPVTGGQVTAAAVPGAELVVIPGMGHEVPVGVRTLIVDAVAENAARVEAVEARPARP
jgi:pimeloyl-ACP methyl ester carboxylesterase